MTHQPGPPPYATGPVPPQHPVQPKKSKTPKILLLVVVAIVAFCGIGGLIAGAGGDDSPATTDSAADAKADSPTAPGPAAAENEPTPGLNTPVRDGKFEFVVTGVETGVAEIGDNPYLRKTAQGSYTIVSITVRNISDVPYGFSPGNQDLYDTEGRKFGNDSMAAISLQPDTSLYASINPGNTITAQMVFDLPAEAQPDYIELHDSMLSGGVTVSLR
ncbi:DUF4352 domain-containing protein [Nocardia sp. 004]|uniref:DUF4352 domain-containing protein n=1 Tax=Nocardia sp. 004 TaxID=3385978 RepID=UPI0039A3ED8B